MLALMLILGFSVGSAVGAGQAPQVVFVGGALSLAANTVYVVRRAYGCRRLTWGSMLRAALRQSRTRPVVKAP